MKKEVKKLIEAWESLEGDKHHSSKDIERWLIKDMKPAIDALRKKLKKK